MIFWTTRSTARLGIASNDAGTARVGKGAWYVALLLGDLEPVMMMLVAEIESHDTLCACVMTGA